MSYGSTINNNLLVGGNLNISSNLTVGSTTNTSTNNLYGNTTINTSNNGYSGSLIINMPHAGSRLVFPTDFSLNGLINTNYGTGLGIYWNGYNSGWGETDFISYGQGGQGGFAFVSMSGSGPNPNKLTPIANFLNPGSGSSEIFTNLDISGNLNVISNTSGLTLTNNSTSNSSVTLNAFNSNDITDFLGVGNKGILLTGGTGSQYGFATSPDGGGPYPIFKFNYDTDSKFNLNYGLDVSGNLDISGNLNVISNTSGLTLTNNSTSNSSVTLNAFNSNDITDFLGVGNKGILLTGGTGSQYGFATSPDGGGPYPIFKFNYDTDSKFNLNYGLDVSGNLDISGNLTVGSESNAFQSTLWGTLYLLNPNSSIAKISFGGGNSGAISCNNIDDGNLYMNTGLDISGTLIFSQPINGTGTQAMNGIQINGQNSTKLCFPLLSNAFNQWTTNGYVPGGLGITWSNQDKGETDLIGYGGGSSSSGGVSIYSYNTNGGTPGGDAGSNNTTLIANFWQDGSTIYNNLTVTQQYTSGAPVSSGIYNYFFDSNSLDSGGLNVFITINVSSGSYGTLFFNVNIPGIGSETISSSYVCAPNGAVQIGPQNNLKVTSNPTMPSMQIFPSGGNSLYLTGVNYFLYSTTPTVNVSVYGTPPTNVFAYFQP